MHESSEPQKKRMTESYGTRSGERVEVDSNYQARMSAHAEGTALPVPHPYITRENAELLSLAIEKMSDEEFSAFEKALIRFEAKVAHESADKTGLQAAIEEFRSGVSGAQIGGGLFALLGGASAATGSPFWGGLMAVSGALLANIQYITAYMQQEKIRRTTSIHVIRKSAEQRRSR